MLWGRELDKVPGHRPTVITFSHDLAMVLIDDCGGSLGFFHTLGNMLPDNLANFINLEQSFRSRANL